MSCIANYDVLHPLVTSDDPPSANHFDLIVFRKGRRSLWRSSKHCAHLLLHNRSSTPTASTPSTLLVGPTVHGVETVLDEMLGSTMDLLVKYLPQLPVETMGMFDYPGDVAGSYYKGQKRDRPTRRELRCPE